MDRLKEKLGTARKALATLKSMRLGPKPDALRRDAAIQRFEYSFEAVWKAAQRYLEIREGAPTSSPKSCIRYSREAGLLSEEQAVTALRMAEDRNLTVHTYKEEQVEKIYPHLKAYAELMDAWLSAIEKRL